jgi:hypothetical protein
MLFLRLGVGVSLALISFEESYPMATVPLASLAMPGVVVRRGEFGLGGFAEHDMAAGSCIASLPFDAILCEDVVWTPPLHPFALAVVDVVRSSRATAPVAARVSSGDAVSRVVDGVPLTTTDCRFALYCFMCLSRCGDGGASDVDAADCTAVRSACDGWGRGISNRWTAYLRCIPTTHHLPVAWTAAQRAWLQGTNLFGASEQRLAELQQWHSALLARVGAEAYAAALTWCVSVIACHVSLKCTSTRACCAACRLDIAAIDDAARLV